MTTAPYGVLNVYDDAAALAQGAAERLLAWALEGPDPVRIALSGGSTPRKTYEFLASPAFVNRFPWPRVHWYFGDERFVPPDHPDSNLRMVREAMFERAPVPAANIHAVQTVGLSAGEAIAAYEAQLQADYGSRVLIAGQPLFHVCLLGLGDDGHTASLLPGEPVLEERARWVAEVSHGRPQTRITLTYPAIDASRHIAFLVSGESKRAVLRDVMSGGSTLPAARLKPVGDMFFLADRAAAGDLAQN